MQNEDKSWPCPNKDAFCSLIVGRRGSGKSSLILKQLLKGGVYHKQFNLIVIISPTVCLDPKWRKLDQEGIVFFDEYQDEIIDTLIEEQTECFRKRKTLVIMDDCANERVHKTSKSLGKLACNGRHLGISVIFSSQVKTKTHFVFSIPHLPLTSIILLTLYSVGAILQQILEGIVTKLLLSPSQHKGRFLVSTLGLVVR
jgi:hypothetical protein